MKILQQNIFFPYYILVSISGILINSIYITCISDTFLMTGKVAASYIPSHFLLIESVWLPVKKLLFPSEESTKRHQQVEKPE